jgi:hypothetical protein
MEGVAEGLGALCEIAGMIEQQLCVVDETLAGRGQRDAFRQMAHEDLNTKFSLDLA